MKRVFLILLSAIIILSAVSCSFSEKDGDKETSNETDIIEQNNENGNITDDTENTDTATGTDDKYADAVKIVLSDGAITVDGEAISSDESADVYAANDIVFYLEGQDFTYGEGSEEDAHPQDEADRHTVVHITKAGTYVISGTLPLGQIAVDLGDDAEGDPDAVVTLVLDNADITCTVAPAVIFYKVYECSDKDNPTKDVDTTAAGANVIIADGSVNTLNGSYVAKIYKSVTLSEDGKTITDSKKLHKYDGTLYSKMTMNIYGDDGILNVNAENEGIDSELHLTIWGGNINISSGDDGINTNEDGVSVTTVNGGNIHIIINGKQGEGDGIDSNGWLVINGGVIVSEACATSGDSGVDSDMGVYLNGGTLAASGNMYDTIDGGDQNYIVFTFRTSQCGGKTYLLKNSDGQTVLECSPTNAFTYLVITSPELTEGEYTLECDGEALLVSEGNSGGMGGRGGLGGGVMHDTGRGEEFGKVPGFPDELADEFSDRLDELYKEFAERSEEYYTNHPDEKPDDAFDLKGAKPEFPGEMGGAKPDMPNGGMGMTDIPNEPVESEASETFSVVSGGNFFTVS